MAGSFSVREDDSIMSRIDRSVFKLESWLNLIGGVVILAIVLLAVANILGRKILNLPVSGYIDWTEQSMAFFAFLGIAYCQRVGGHIRMDIFVGSLRGRALWFFEFVSTFLMFCLTVLLIYGSWLHFKRAWDIGDTSIDIELPTWPAKLVVPIALTVLALRLLVQLWAYARALKAGGDEPVAVPLIEDAATQAQHEAEQSADAKDMIEADASANEQQEANTGDKS